MDEHIQLYSFVRSGASIYLARVDKMVIQAGLPGQRRVSLQLRIEETLWGQPGAPIRHFSLTQPESEIVRRKFLHYSVWGLINLREGILLLLVTDELSEAPAEPLYVEEIVDPDDPVLSVVRAALDQFRAVSDQEQTEPDGNARITHYLHGLTDVPTVPKLFGAEALAEGIELAGGDRQGQVAKAIATIFASGESVYVRWSMGAWMWDKVYPRTTTTGKVAIINATIMGVEDASEDIRRFSLDHLMMADPVDLRQAGVTKSSTASRLLQKQRQLESSPDARNQIQRVIDALRP
jgi:hypothetical protein